MTKDQLAQLLQYLEDLAPSNEERKVKLKEIIEGKHPDELNQLDMPSMVFLLEVIQEAERRNLKIKVVLPVSNIRFKRRPVNDMQVRNDDDFDEADYEWGI